jgi:hypothetical protein
MLCFVAVPNKDCFTRRGEDADCSIDGDISVGGVGAVADGQKGLLQAEPLTLLQHTQKLIFFVSFYLLCS